MLGKSRIDFSLFKRHIFAFKLLMDMDGYFLTGQVKGYMTNQKIFINIYTNCQSNHYSQKKCKQQYLGELYRCGALTKNKITSLRGKCHFSLATNARTAISGKRRGLFFLSKFKLFVKKCSYSMIFKGYSLLSHSNQNVSTFQNLQGTFSLNPEFSFDLCLHHGQILLLI